MNNKLLDALETCLQALEGGETLDSVLTRFPAQAADLRPMLEASLHARTLNGPPPSDAVQRRGRARLLQRAAQMRESRRAPRRTWLYNFRPLAVALMLVVFFLSGTGLVRASSGALPGDNLYIFKRVWEGLRLALTFASEERVHLEMEYENERLEEISELLTEGRVEAISFSGYVTAQKEGQWTVSGIPVAISAQTKLPNEPIKVGSVVTLYGITTLDGQVNVQSVDIVPPGTPIPTPRPEEEEEEEDEEEEESGSRGGSGETPGKTEPTPAPVKEAGGLDESSSFVGVVESMNGDLWVINGLVVDVSGAEIVGTPVPGASVTIEGRLNEKGVFVATKIIFSGSGAVTATETPDDDSEEKPKETPEGEEEEEEEEEDDEEED